LDSIPIADSNADYLVIWVFFTLFVGLALAIDFGIIGKILHILRVKNRSGNRDNNTYQRRETSLFFLQNKSQLNKNKIYNNKLSKEL
jgi:hypothetical protein